MSTSEIEKHLRNQIISLNKEIHTKQGIIGGVKVVTSNKDLRFCFVIRDLTLKEKQRYYLKQYMEFSTKYRFVC